LSERGVGWRLVKIAGGNRKYLLHKLANWGKTTALRLDEKAVRLKASPFMRELMGFLEMLFRITQGDKEMLLSVSPSTIDRLLKADRKRLALRGEKQHEAGKLLKKQIPVRTYYADAPRLPPRTSIPAGQRQRQRAHPIHAFLGLPLPVPPA
jgi:hypothetical protein